MPTFSDPMGAAILHYQQHGQAAPIRVLSSLFDDDEIPVEHLFRSFSEMPPLEQQALRLARGRVLDVGAGAGCHSLALQEQGFTVCAVDISPLSCQAMRLRGIHDVRCCNILTDDLLTPASSSSADDPSAATSASEQRFDTILLLMNGTGIAGTLAALPAFLHRIATLLAPNGQILIDSSDLKYLYENEDGSYDIDLLADYYGEIDYQMVFGQHRGKPFNWLYADYASLHHAATEAHLQCSLLAEGEHFDYLARLTR